jgi:hypothetical protein
VYVPFKYDLGGRVGDISRVVGVLTGLCKAVEVDQAVARSWNLSYLARHPPVLRCPLPGGTVEWAGAEWNYERTLRLYPDLGVLSIDYGYEVRRGKPNILAFYDGLVSWKNSDYLPYLGQFGVKFDGLATGTVPASAVPVQDLHAGLVSTLRASLRPYVTPRPELYIFHDFRVCFIDRGSALDGRTVQSLLWLTPSTAVDHAVEGVAQDEYGPVEILSTGWSTVLRTKSAAAGPETTTSLSLLNLIHAQWFLCQAWTSIYDKDFFDDDGDVGVRVGPHELTRCQLLLARDLTEVGNLDLMLKDPNLLRAARTLERSFGVMEHRTTAERRLRVLENHSRALSQFVNEREVRRLQILFSISAAGVVAGLIPALVIAQADLLLTFLTTATVVVLWLGFAINFAAMLRRFGGRRKRRPRWRLGRR